MSYEKHIKALEAAKDYEEPGPSAIAAFDAAIALMRSAEPKDEAAEREHCDRVAIELANVRAPRGGGAANHFQSHAQDKIAGERASARAEGTAGRAKIMQLQTQLDEARSEIERLQTIASKLVTQADEHERKLWPGKLSEARAEIAVLRIAALQRDEFYDKLMNLRVAVERYRELKFNAAWDLVLDAIESSK